MEENPPGEVVQPPLGLADAVHRVADWFGYPTATAARTALLDARKVLRNPPGEEHPLAAALAAELLAVGLTPQALRIPSDTVL